MKLRKKYASERKTQENYASQKQKQTQRPARKRPCVEKRKNRARFYFLALTQGDSQ